MSEFHSFRVRRFTEIITGSTFRNRFFFYSIRGKRWSFVKFAINLLNQTFRDIWWKSLTWNSRPAIARINIFTVQLINKLWEYIVVTAQRGWTDYLKYIYSAKLQICFYSMPYVCKVLFSSLEIISGLTLPVLWIHHFVSSLSFIVKLGNRIFECFKIFSTFHLV